MREHLVLTILMQVKEMYNNFVKEERIWNPIVLDDNILEKDPMDGYIDARLIRDDYDDLADTYFDLIKTYKKYYKIYKEATFAH